MNRRDAIAALVSLPAVSSIGRLEVRPTTTIVVECHEHLTRAVVEQIRTDVQKVWPNNRVLVCDRSIRLRVVDEPAG